MDGRTSDKYLNKLLPGDLVIADRGFNMGDSVAIMGARMEIPAFTKGREQLSAQEIETTRELANARIHVESHRSHAPEVYCSISNVSSIKGVCTNQV